MNPAEASASVTLRRVASDGRQHSYRSFVLEKAGDKEDLLDRAVARDLLGTASWIDRVQALVALNGRSEEFPAQVHPGRPELEDVITAVAATFDTTPEAIVASHDTLERRLSPALRSKKAPFRSVISFTAI